MKGGYDHRKIEAKWRKAWEKGKLYEAKNGSKKPKFYSLIEFPYPSGAGLHVGHPRPYIGLDVVSRKRRAEGFNVLYPIGWDAFGLPTENYAIKTGKDPAVITKENTDTFRKQIKSLGVSFDWSREINTTDPKYYKWTQWIFLQFYEHGLAYKAKMTINWCPKDKIGLANEEVINGTCERCGTPVEKREKEQWMLAITKYADRLDKDLDLVDYRPDIKQQQRNWIGRSEGAEIEFPISNFRFPNEEKSKIKVFTTRPDTIFGATYLVLAPEHPLIENLKLKIKNWNKVELYLKEAQRKSEIERTAETKDKTGVKLDGVTALNPATNEEIPVFIADYVLAHYGTGAIMAVPAHDERDFEFAKKFSLPIKAVIMPADQTYRNRNQEEIKITKGDSNYSTAVRAVSKSLIQLPTTSPGVLINSGKFDGMNSNETKQAITEAVGGKIVTTYKLRDWVFSRQRYWGEPIPMIHCETCGWVPVPEKDLPVKLPKVKNYKPADTGESPLSDIASWVNVKCPKCKGKARRETDTMPNWAGSSWYFLRYTDPHNQKAFAGWKNLEYWMPVDWYNGGMEHTTLHLLYARFWHKFLYDLKLVPEPEPFKKRTSHGLIIAEDGEKMSKSRGNVINPDDIAETFGADTLRIYEMFMGPFDQAIRWSTDNMIGSRRFLERVWNLKEKIRRGKTKPHTDLESSVHKTVKKVSEDIESMGFNTAVSAMMILVNEFEKAESIPASYYETLLKLLAPFAPFITEELWALCGHKKSIHLEKWPKYDPALLVGAEATIVLQVNGKVRGNFKLPQDALEAQVKEAALNTEEGRKWIGEGTVERVIFVPNKLINFVVR